MDEKANRTATNIVNYLVGPGVGKPLVKEKDISKIKNSLIKKLALIIEKGMR